MQKFGVSQQEINRLITVLKGLGSEIRSAAKNDLREAGSLMLSAVKARAPIGKTKHSRYRNVGRNRAAKGTGVIEATYNPGNLKKSFRVLPLRRAKSAVFIGPLVGANRRFDGYYAHWVNNDTKNVDGSIRTGSKFVDDAYEAAEPIVSRTIINLLSRRVSAYIQSTGAFSLEKYARAKGRE